MYKVILSTLVMLFIFIGLGYSQADKNTIHQEAIQNESIQPESLVENVTDPMTAPDSSGSKTENNVINYVKNHTGITLIVIVFLLMLVIPFVPALREMFKPKDNKPLLIDKDYTRDPRFLDKHLMEEIKPALEASNDNLKNIKYKNNVTIEKVKDYKASEPVTQNHLLIVTGDMKVNNGSTFKQPVYVQGKTGLGDNCHLEILMSEGEMITGKNTQIGQWVSSNANIKVGESSVLGKKAVCSGILQMAKGTQFSNLYAMPVATYDVDFNLDLSKPAAVETTAVQEESMTEVSDMNWYISKGFMTIPPFSLVNNSMVVKSDLVLRRGVVVNGNIKVYGKVILDKDVRIYGELISNGDIEVGEFSYIRENLFTQSKIHIKNGVRIGLPGQSKSIIGKKGVSLEKNVILYGNIVTAGKGVVL